jgi:hypothetical protein
MTRKSIRCRSSLFRELFEEQDRLGMPSNVLAERAGVNVVSLSMIRRGKTYGTILFAENLAKALGLRITITRE